MTPTEALASEVSKKKGKAISYGEIGAIARSFSVSKHMIFVRLNSTGLLTSHDSIELSKIFGKERTGASTVKIVKKQPENEMRGPPQHRRCISEQGKKFVSLVLENANKNQITTAKALEYLSVRLDNLPKVEAAMRR